MGVSVAQAGDGLSPALLRVFRLPGWRRLAARAFDTALMTAPIVGAFVWANDYHSTHAPGAVEDYYALVYVLAAAVSLAWVVVGWTLYEYFTTAAAGRTLGKWLFGLRVVREGGAQVGPWRAFGRAIVSMVMSLTCIPILVVFSPIGLYIWVGALALPALVSRRTFVDCLVETCVVRSPRLSRQAVATTNLRVLET